MTAPDTRKRSKWDPAFGLIGRLTAIAGLVAAILGLWSRFVAPSTDLKARINFGRQLWPLELEEPIARADATPIPNSLSSLADAGPIAEVIEQQASPENDAFNMALAIERKSSSQGSPSELEIDRLAKVIQEVNEDQRADHTAKLAQLIARDLEHRVAEAKRKWPVGLGGFYHIVVTNEGSLPAKEVRVKFPSETAGEIRGPGDKRTTAKGASFGLGDIQPAEAIEVVVWESIRTDHIRANQIVVSYSGGLADVSLAGGPEWWQSFLNGLDAVGFLLLTLVAATLVGLLVSTTVSRRTTQKEPVAKDLDNESGEKSESEERSSSE